MVTVLCVERSIKNQKVSFLNGANLSDANLTYTNLYDVDFTEANLTGADLTEAYWNRTICPDGTKQIRNSPCTTHQLNLA